MNLLTGASLLALAKSIYYLITIKAKGNWIKISLLSEDYCCTGIALTPESRNHWTDFVSQNHVE